MSWNTFFPLVFGRCWKTLPTALSPQPESLDPLGNLEPCSPFPFCQTPQQEKTWTRAQGGRMEKQATSTSKIKSPWKWVMAGVQDWTHKVLTLGENWHWSPSSTCSHTCSWALSFFPTIPLLVFYVSKEPWFPHQLANRCTNATKRSLQLTPGNTGETSHMPQSPTSQQLLPLQGVPITSLSWLSLATYHFEL